MYTAIVTLFARVSFVVVIRLEISWTTESRQRSCRTVSSLALCVLYLFLLHNYATIRQSSVKNNEKLPDHFVKMSVLSLPPPPHRLLSGGQGPAPLLAGIRCLRCAPWVHVGRSEVPLPPWEPAGVRRGPPLPARRTWSQRTAGWGSRLTDTGKYNHCLLKSEKIYKIWTSKKEQFTIFGNTFIWCLVKSEMSKQSWNMLSLVSH